MMPNPEDIATEDLASSQSSLAISSAHHHGARSIFVFLAELVSLFRILESVSYFWGLVVLGQNQQTAKQGLATFLK